MSERQSRCSLVLGAIPAALTLPIMHAPAHAAMLLGFGQWTERGEK
jgi:hypothetical protein